MVRVRWGVHEITHLPRGTHTQMVEAGAGGLDLGDSAGAPLQPTSSGPFGVSLWFNLADTYSGACGSQPIAVLAARLHYPSSELAAQSVTNHWLPHSGSYQGTLQRTPVPRGRHIQRSQLVQERADCWVSLCKAGKARTSAALWH